MPRFVPAFCGVLCFYLVSTFASAQLATFNVQQSSALPYTSTMITVDLNGDGIPDLVQTYSRVPVDSTFSVQIAKGDGTFAAPVSYPLPIRQQTSVLFASGDVNHDGKADVLLINEQDLSVYLGNGDGTLASPKNITLPNYAQGLFVADFNHDGKPDVAITIMQTVAVMYGDGQGGFSNPVTILTVAPDQGVIAYGVGDFDADSNADIAIGIINGPCNPSTCDHTDIHILYGNGSSSFIDKLVYPGVKGSLFILATGDINGDGNTDLAAALPFLTQNGQNTLVLYGHPKRTVSSQYLASNGYEGQMAISDVNGDGRNDIAMAAGNGSNQVVIGFFLAGPNHTFTWQQIPFFSGRFEMGNLLAGDFNRDRKTDLTLAATSESNGDNLTIVYDYLNTTAARNWSPCDYPAAAHGIKLCSPVNGATVGPKVHFKVSATWFEPLRKIEVWVDGKKIVEQHHVWDKYGWLKATRTFSIGTHHVDVYSAGYDNARQHQSSTFTVQ